MQTREKTPFDTLPVQTQCAEIFYRRALEMTKVMYAAINRAYPLSERNLNHRVKYLYEEAHGTTKQHLNFVKTVVREDLFSLTKIKKHPISYDDSQDQHTKDLKIMVGVQFDRLRDLFVRYADLLVPKEDVPSLLSTLEKVYPIERAMLLAGPPPDGLDHYEFESKLKKEDFE